MHAPKKVDQLNRSQRLSQIERFILLGLTLAEMAERLGVTPRTIQRDLKDRIDEWTNDIERSTQAYRQSILSELGRLYAEATKDAAIARSEKRDTHQYVHARTDILRMIGKITGAEAPVKVEVSGQVEHAVQLVPQSELLALAEFTREVEAEVTGDAV